MLRFIGQNTGNWLFNVIMLYSAEFNYNKHKIVDSSTVLIEHTMLKSNQTTNRLQQTSQS